MNETKDLPYKYYKGMREIYTSGRDCVAWTNIQICFRNRNEEPLNNTLSDALLRILQLYANVSDEVRYVKPLSLDSDCFSTAKYGVEIETNYTQDKKGKDIAEEMLETILKIVGEYDIIDRLLSSRKFEKISMEQKVEIANEMLIDLDLIKPEIIEMLKMVKDEKRYVYVENKY